MRYRGAMIGRAACSSLLGGATVPTLVMAATLLDGAGLGSYKLGVRQRDAESHEGEGYIAVECVRRAGSIHADSAVGPPGDLAYHKGWADSPEAVLGGMLRAPALPWPYGREAWPADGEYASRMVVARGWPWPALWHDYRYDWERDPGRQDPALHRPWPPPEAFGVPGGVRLGASTVSFCLDAHRMPRAVPYRPVWLGFLGDWLVFAVSCFGLMTGASLVKRLVRHRGGRCEGCGFDLHGLPRGARCPECGEPQLAVTAPPEPKAMARWTRMDPRPPTIPHA